MQSLKKQTSSIVCNLRSICFFAIGLIYICPFACTEKESASEIESVKLSTRNGVIDSLQVDSYVFYDTLALFWDASAETIYFIQFSNGNLFNLGEEFELVDYNDTGGRPMLIMSSIHSGTTVLDTFTISGNIYGLGYMQGSENVASYMNLNSAGAWVFPEDPDIQEVICSCFKKGTPPPENCQHGGTGATGCGASEGTPLYEKSCNVNCNSSTHYACCNDHDVTWQWD